MSNVPLLASSMLLIICVSTYSFPLQATIIVQTDSFGKATETNPTGSDCTDVNKQNNECLGGISRKATLFQQVLNETEGDAVFLDMGNTMAIGELYRFYRGDVEAFMFRRYNFSAIVPKNLDWTLSVDEPDRLQIKSGVPVVSANILRRSSNRRAYHPYVLVRLPNGLVIGIIGSNSETELTAGHVFSDDFIIGNPIGYVSEAVGEVKVLGANAVIVLDNSGKLDPDVQAEFIKSHPFVDVHIVNHIDSFYGNASIFTCGEQCTYGRSILRIDLAFAANLSVVGARSEIIPVSPTIPDEPDVQLYLQQKLEEFHNATDAIVVAESDFTSSFMEYPTDFKNFSHSTGDIVADAFMNTARNYNIVADIGLVNKGSIRATFPKGPIIRNRVGQILPFFDTVCAFSIKGSYLLKALQASTKLALFGSFPEVSGARFQWNPDLQDRIDLGGITSISVQDPVTKTWSQFSIEKSYVVVTSSFVCNGGDEFQLLKENGFDFHENLDSVLDSVIGYLEQEKMLYASNYTTPRGELTTDPSAIRLTGDCEKGKYLDENGSCKLCPVVNTVVDFKIVQTQDLWAISAIVVDALLDSELSQPITMQAVLMNQGPYAVSWRADPADSEFVTLSPEYGLISGAQSLVINATWVISVAKRAPFITINVIGRDLSSVFLCYTPLSVRFPIRYKPLYVRYFYPWILFPIIMISYVFVMGFLVMSTCLIWRNRRSAMIRASSPTLLLINIAGAMVLSSGSIVFSILPNGANANAICELRWWLPGLGFSIMLSPLLMKIYRIDKIFVSDTIRMISIPNSLLLKGVAAMVSAMVALLTIHSIMFPSVSVVLPATDIPTDAPDDHTITLDQCTTYDVYVAVILTTCALFVAWGARLAWHARSAPADFNESPSISVALMFISIYAVLILPLLYLLDANPAVLVILRGLGINVGVGVSMAALYLGKLDMILRGNAHTIPNTRLQLHQMPTVLTTDG